ncbi:hypothetical protein [Siphonobacter sp.]|uniref:hypothetical protein n=1 Tax=Siphonobacter sp. TaxID=1869184 RepID=UPI003B3B0D6B
MKAKQLLSTACFVAALLTSSSLMAQVKVGTNPTTIESASNLEVEASTTGRKVKVDKATGQLTIADGTQGTGKVLTSDANGGASWQTSQLVKATVTYTNDGVVTLPSQPTGTGSTFGNVSITFPVNGTYALSWAVIGDYTTYPTEVKPQDWFGVIIPGLVNHQESQIVAAFNFFSSGVRYVTITDAPKTVQVNYINTSTTPMTLRSNSGKNYHEWFAYKVF